MPGTGSPLTCVSSPGGRRSGFGDRPTGSVEPQPGDRPVGKYWAAAGAAVIEGTCHHWASLPPSYQIRTIPFRTGCVRRQYRLVEYGPAGRGRVMSHISASYPAVPSSYLRCSRWLQRASFIKDTVFVNVRSDYTHTSLVVIMLKGVGEN